MSDTVLDTLDAYLDLVPRPATRPEDIGELVLFVPAAHAGWPYYARPRRGRQPGPGDLERTRRRQRELGLPEDFEWVVELVPGLAGAARRAGLRVEENPLLVLRDPARLSDRRPPGEVEIRLVGPDDDLALIRAVPAVGFSYPGTAPGAVGVEALPAAAAARRSSARLDFERERLRRGLTVVAAAFADGSPVAYGAHQPVAGVTEIVGVATLPAFRRRGLGVALTAFLTEDAMRRSVETVFLSAASSDVARMYAYLGFVRVGSTGAASAAG